MALQTLTVRSVPPVASLPPGQRSRQVTAPADTDDIKKIFKYIKLNTVNVITELICHDCVCVHLVISDIINSSPSFQHKLKTICLHMKLNILWVPNDAIKTTILTSVYMLTTI